ncbi:hypothetical protein C8Q70DRAFT_894013, partial [Cubamyces menziesii]
MWLKDYLNLTEHRETWTYLADALLARAAASGDRNVDEDARTNAYLQKWDVSTRRTAGLPDKLKRMVKVAKKYNVGPDAPNPTQAVRALMPIWYHCAADGDSRGPNSKSGKCLRKKHGVRTVGQCMTLIEERSQLAGNQHRRNANCECIPCTRDRIDRGCDNPARCTTAAEKLIRTIYPKWNPRREPQKDSLSITKSGRERNKLAQEENGRITFDPSVTQGTPLATIFRVFRKYDQVQQAATRLPRPYQLDNQEIEIFTDGSCLKNGRMDAQAGSGIWVGEGSPQNRAERVPYENQTNQTGELYAVMLAHKATPPYIPLHIVTD